MFTLASEHIPLLNLFYLFEKTTLLFFTEFLQFGNNGRGNLNVNMI